MKEFNKQIQKKFDEMCQTGKLFRSSMSPSLVWKLYLKSFPSDPVFRDPESTVHNCNHCHNFIRRYGNIVAIDANFNVISMFDVEADEEYIESAKTMASALKNAPISEVFYETHNELQSLPYEKCSLHNPTYRLGIDKNEKRYTKEEADKFGVVTDGQIMTFNHFYLDLPKAFVDSTGLSVEAIMGRYRDAKNVFQRGMEEIALDTLMLVKDFINQDSILDGRTHLHKIDAMIPLKQEYDSLEASLRDNWCWVRSHNFNFAKFRNELIGTLCVELSEGEDINKACQTWNKRVDPANYMKATAPITKNQIEEAKKFVELNGYEESFDRRLATIEDIKVSEIKHINAGKEGIKNVSVFDGLKSTSTRHKRSQFDGIEEIGIEKFMKDILPGCYSVEVFLSNSHENNFVSLTTAKKETSKPIFKWNNNYSWTYNGNLAGKSMIKQAVKDAGGKVDGVLNFRLAWNDDTEANDNSDLDAWAEEASGQSIGYSTSYKKGRGRRSPNSGELDVDNTSPSGRLAVENITWADKTQMKDGAYRLWVNQYNNRNSKGFKAEIEVEGETHLFEYNQPVNGNISVAEVILSQGVFTVKPALQEVGVATKEIYGLETNTFHKVNLLCLSPNHWEPSEVGNKHYFFMLEGSKSPYPVRSFHNENLMPDLLGHRKVIEVLGANSTVPSVDKQLSGLGFNATVREELIVKLGGTHNRMIKIKF